MFSVVGRTSMRRAGFVGLISIIALAALGKIAASEEARQPELIHSPWTKFCMKDMCFVGGDRHTDCGVVLAAVLIEQTGQQKRTLRVTLPARVKVEHGVRITIDQR